MPNFNYLPGTIVNTLDGGLTSAVVPQDDSILVIGTAGSGPAHTPYQVSDRAVAAQTFGLNGSLLRAVEECALYSDNIIAFRMGTSPMVLSGVGVDTQAGATTPGFSITFGQVTSTAATDYTIWYKNGVLSVWYKGTLVFSNVSGAAVDTGDLTINPSIRPGPSRPPHITRPARGRGPGTPALTVPALTIPPALPHAMLRQSLTSSSTLIALQSESPQIMVRSPAAGTDTSRQAAHLFFVQMTTVTSSSRVIQETKSRQIPTGKLWHRFSTQRSPNTRFQADFPVTMQHK